MNKFKLSAQRKEEFKWIYKYSKRNLWLIVIYTLLGLSGTALSLLSSLVSRDLVDIITGNNSGDLIKNFAGIIIMTLVNVGVSQFSTIISTKISLKVDNEIKVEFYDELMNTDWQSLNRYHTGDLIARWSGDVSSVSRGILNLIPNFIIYTCRFFVSLYMVVIYDWSFALVALLSLPLTLFVSRKNVKRLKNSDMGSLKINSRMTSFTQESFQSTQTIKAFDMVPLYSRRLRELQAKYTDSKLKNQKISSFNSILFTLTTLIVTYSAYGWGIYKVWSGQITYGTMTMFLSLSSSLTGTLQSLINLLPNAISITNAAGRIMTLLKLPKEDNTNKDKVKDFIERNKEKGLGVSINKSCFSYSNGNKVFNDASFEALPGQVVSLVGPSGEGKTTLLRLILAIINSKDGDNYIFSEGKKEKIPLSASTRQAFAYVPQGNTMFSGTVASNLRNVKETATDEEIIEALKTALAWDFIKKLPDTINSEIKENGGGFSEGQAQRLSIARALLKESPILLLDEATSALDLETEKKVLENIVNSPYPRTLIVTSHRPAILSLSDKIYKIKDLTIEEKK